MNEWRIRYKHHKALRNSRFLSVGIEPPVDEVYGELSKVKESTKHINGKKFWSMFRAKGHSSCIFDECICNTNK